jgi:DNA-binding CsgD family transcriptional regulator
MENDAMQLLERDSDLAAAEQVLDSGGLLIIEGGAGIGKTSLLDAIVGAAETGREVLSARGSELEADFPFGVVRQLFERRLARASPRELSRLLAGPASAVHPLFTGALSAAPGEDTWFSVLHGLYWLVANLATLKPLMLVVDDAHWADTPSARWLAYLASRIEGLDLNVIVALRPNEPASQDTPLLSVRSVATTVVRPQLLSRAGVDAIVRTRLGGAATDEVCHAVAGASGGNPFYVLELLRDAKEDGAHAGQLQPEYLVGRGGEGLSAQVAARLRRLDPKALRLAQILAILGDGCELRHAATIAVADMPAALQLAATLVSLDVLAAADPPRFLHPVIRSALEASLDIDGRDAAHRAAAQMLDQEHARSELVAAHLVHLRRSGDQWVVERLRLAARAAIDSGTPESGATLLRRALAEPPAPETRIAVLREAGHAETLLGRVSACALLDEAIQLTGVSGERAAIGLQLAEAYGSAFRWVDAADACTRALEDLGDANPALAARLEAQLAVCGLRDSRRAQLAHGRLERLATLQLTSGTAEAFAVARAIDGLWFKGLAAPQIALPLAQAFNAAGPRPENWDLRAPGLWALIVAEGFDAAEATLTAMMNEVQRSGSARGMFVTYAINGLLKFRLGALPDADATARIALRVMQSADFATGLPLGLHVLADVAIEAGELDEAKSLVDQLPKGEVPAGLGTAHIEPVRGRLLLAQGRPGEALKQFERARSRFSEAVWGLPTHDNGFLHARSSAALALLHLGDRERALGLANSELEDARKFGGSRALGIALRVAGLAHGGMQGLGLLEESVSVHTMSPALLERAHSLVEYGAALRRAGRRGAAQEPLAQALDLAARCGARPLAARAREELNATGARPRREWRTGVEALTPSELRVVRLAAEGRTNREIAQTLYVTMKTVEGHLARAYGKLEVSGRAELPRLFDDDRAGRLSRA